MVTAFFSKYGVKIAVVMFLLGIVVFFIFDYKNIKNELVVKKAEILIMSDRIASQNEHIGKLKIDVDTYKNKKPQIVEKIVTKYEEIEVKDETCEAKLDAIYEAQKVFFKSVNKDANNPFERVKSKDIK